LFLNYVVADVPLAGGASFLGTGTGTFSSGIGLLGTSGTLKNISLWFLSYL